MTHFRNPDLPLLAEIPEDGHLVDYRGFIKDWQKAIKQNRVEPTYYFCEYCKGFIQGKPSRGSENSIGPLAGRCGQSYNCIRCGRELDFFGYMS